MPKLAFSQILDCLHLISDRAVFTENFLRDLLLAFGRSSSSVTQLVNGTIDKDPDDASTRLQKGIIYFKFVESPDELDKTLTDLESNPLTTVYQPRYLLVVNSTHFAAKDRTLDHTASDTIAHLDDYVEFFYALSGDEFCIDSNSASFTNYLAADRIKYLYDELRQSNLTEFEDMPVDFRHELNLFFGRLLLCLFAEDLAIFRPGQFLHALEQSTSRDGYDVATFLEQVFREVGTFYLPVKRHFAYIGSDLFDLAQHPGIIPKFNSRSRYLLIRLAELDWSHINPDIFGTIFQNIVDPDRRHLHGMDYTSVSNIEKVIRPLFLDDLEASYQQNYTSARELKALWQRIAAIKIFDPACGSGNFLIISFKRLSELELNIISRLHDLGAVNDDTIYSRIRLSNFYGIELEDLPVILARVSMFVAARQMQLKFFRNFPKLKNQMSIHSTVSKPQIVCGNAVRLDWQQVCPNVPHPPSSTMGVQAGNQNLIHDEIYLIGNPPYKGAKRQTANMKSDFSFYFGDEEYSRNLDYISLWFLKGARYIAGTRAEVAFVSTNSICQGEHAALLFPKLLAENVEIKFAHTSFRWQNNAEHTAVVTVVIIGLSSHHYDAKRLFINNAVHKVSYINPYLLPSKSEIVQARSDPLSPDLPRIFLGSQPIDGGHLILNEAEYEELVKTHPAAKRFIHPFMGGNEYINQKIRFCILVDDRDFPAADRFPLLHQRFLQVRAYREHSSCKMLANLPCKFAKLRYNARPALLIPRISSELRDYLPLGPVSAETVISDGAHFIEDPPSWLFAILTSRMHMVWARLLAGRLETRLRYSSTLVCNTFPLPPLSIQDRATLTTFGNRILALRSQFPHLSLAKLYDPARMPTELKTAHLDNDQCVDQLFGHSFSDDTDRLSELLQRYTSYLNLKT